MRKHGKHARHSRAARRFGVAAAAGGAAALVATFPGSPAHASAVPGPGDVPAGSEPVVVQPEHGIPHPVTAVTAATFNPARYTIRTGDTLGAIAGRFCGTPGKYPNLAAANRIANPDFILAGALLDASQRACHHKPLVIRKPVTAAVVTSNVPRYRRHHAWSQPRPATVYRYAGTYSFAGLEQLWVSAGGPAWAERSAAVVAMCESGGRSNAYNPSGASGLFQILGAVIPGNLFDPYVNARNAVAKFEASGDTWAQWVCKP